MWQPVCVRNKQAYKCYFVSVFSMRTCIVMPATGTDAQLRNAGPYAYTVHSRHTRTITPARPRL